MFIGVKTHSRDYEIQGSPLSKLFTITAAAANLIFVFNTGMLPEIQVIKTVLTFSKCDFLFFCLYRRIIILLLYDALVGHSETTGGEKHDEGSILPVHDRCFTDVGGYIHRILGLRFLNLDLSAKQCYWPTLGQSPC